MYIYLLSFLFLILNMELLIGILFVMLLCYISKMFMISDVYLFNSSNMMFYECGFEYGMGSCGFSLQFYVISFSFLLFDLEICLFTPLVMSVYYSSMGYLMGVIFLFLLLMVLIMELMMGALDW